MDPYSYLCFVFVFVILFFFCSLQPCGHLIGKNWPLGSPVCNIFLCSYMYWVRCGTWLYRFLTLLNIGSERTLIFIEIYLNRQYIPILLLFLQKPFTITKRTGIHYSNICVLCVFSLFFVIENLLAYIFFIYAPLSCTFIYEWAEPFMRNQIWDL